MSKPQLLDMARATIVALYSNTRDEPSAIAAGSSKPKLMMLAPHEPTLDPRVHYTAQSLAKKFDVVLLAAMHESDRRPEANYPTNPSYATQRAVLRSRQVIATAFDFAKIAAKRLLGSAPLLVIFFVAALLLTLGSLAVGVVGLAAFLLDVVAITIAAPFVLIVRTIRLLRAPLSYAILRAVRRRIPPGVPAFLTNLSSGVRVTASVFKFTFAANATLLDSIATSGERPDYIYCHDLYCLQTAVTTKLKWGSRVVYDSHEYYPHLYRYPLFVFLTRLYERVLVHFVDTYITVSPQLADALKQDYCRNTIVVIPNVEPLPADVPAAAGEMSSLAADRLKLLYQGNFAEGRGLEEVLREWRHVDGTRAALFLRGLQNPWRDRIETIAREAGLLGKSVYILPPVLERDLIPAAAEADLGLIPYKVESKAYRFACPNKLSQYLHAGLAIVANSIPFVRGMVEEQGIGVWYDSDQAGSFARVVNRLSADPAEVSRLRTRAAATARDAYCWEKYEDMLLAAVEAA
jgi:glycosyltransferase involved in cell wall biosynthesis